MPTYYRHYATKNMLTVILTLSLLCSTLAPIASADNDYSELIQEDATSVAEAFILSVVGTDVTWTEDTIISNTIEMHDEYGAVSAYSFELTTEDKDTGYIIVAAHTDVPNLILEYADQVAPLYESLDISSYDEIIYVGAFGYYKDLGDEQVEDLYENVISLEEVEDVLDEIKSDEYISENQQIVEIAKDNEEIYEVADEDVVCAATAVNPINDPFVYANNKYNDIYKSYEWLNSYESYVPFHTQIQFSSNPHNCGPTAITNIIEFNGYRSFISSIFSVSSVTIYSKVENLGIAKGYYKVLTGTDKDTFEKYVKESFALFDTTVITSNRTVNFSNIKNEIQSSWPFILLLTNNDIYGRHAVMGYAYTRLKGQNTGVYMDFVKIADGIVSYGRYLDIGQITATQNKMCTVHYYR